MALHESVKLTHFNDRLPELHNIYIPDRKFKYVLVHNGKKFELKILDDIMYDLIERHTSNIQDLLKMENIYFEESKLPYVKKIIQRANELYDDLDKNIFKRDEIITEIKFILYNNREQVINNYNKYHTNNLLEDI
jgi:hypothetical protein